MGCVQVLRQLLLWYNVKLSEMIENLQKFMSEHGDVDCWWAVDDEGNEYKEVIYEPTLMYKNEHGDAYCQKDIDDVEKICIIN